MSVLQPLGRLLTQTRHRRRAGRPKVVVKQRGPHRLEAAAWFALAGVILAGARPAGGSAAGTSPGQPRPLWRRIWSQLTGIAPETPETEVSAAEADQPGRGRDARAPSEIPAAGWKDVLWRTWNEFNKDRVPAVAGGVAFFGLLALFPGLGAFVSLYGLFSDVHSVLKQLDILAGLLPADALSFVGDQMIRLATSNTGGLSLAFAVSLFLSLWSANAGIKALMDGLNIVYEERERRGFIRLNLISLAFTVGAIVLIVVALTLVVAAPIVLMLFGYGGPDLMGVLRWPLLLAMIVVFLELLYRYGPSREAARWRWVSWGSVGAALVWMGASMAFSWYVTNFAHYDRTYGSLGAVVAFMTWMWISIIVVLAGAELNAEIEHQTAVDSTTGAPRPMGKRGAKMADTLGETAQKAKEKPKEIKKADPRAERAGAEPAPSNSEPKPT
ncbi:MAG TPA: YihY/virulence factor BrkB family protein [Caulobacteraceae bacterium]|jgi:membrane protein|nr:YihY/virulence factor BrkB family protein [Caulobacteraceae bacterium]